MPKRTVSKALLYNLHNESNNTICRTPVQFLRTILDFLSRSDAIVFALCCFGVVVKGNDEKQGELVPSLRRLKQTKSH